MTTAIDTPRTLQERVGDRIRDQIGDLMTDADLKLLVDRAMDDAFFKERVTMDSSGYRRETKPPQIVEAVANLLQKRVDIAIQAWLVEHGDEVKKHIDEAMGSHMFRFLLQWMENRTSGPAFSAVNELQRRLGIA